MGALYRIALVIAIIGAVNWGLIGLFQLDLVASIFGGPDSTLSRLIYAIVGVSGLICIPLLSKPLVDEEASTSSASTNTRSAYRNPSYQTEFGEEEDFSNLSDADRNPKSNNNSSSNQ